MSSNLAGCASLSHKIRHLESWRFVRAMLVEFAEALRKQREANIGVARRRTRRSKRAVHGGFTASAIDRQTPSLTRETSLRYLLGDAPVAQLDRAPPSEGGGHTFESCRACHFPSIAAFPTTRLRRLAAIRIPLAPAPPILRHTPKQSITSQRGLLLRQTSLLGFEFEAQQP